MDEPHVRNRPALRHLAKQLQVRLADPVQRRRGVVLEQHPQERLELRRRPQLYGELFGTPQQLVGIADDPRPPKLSKAIDDVPWARADQRDVAAVDDAVDTSALDIRGNSFERREVPVNV
jgi:hypothetical protein